MTNISKLTNDCLSQISSLTSAKDVVGLTSALKQLATALESNAVWEKFLPSDCDDIISRSSSSIPPDLLASKKKLFYYLSRFPILLDEDTKSFALDETSGKICYMLGAMALSITWDGIPKYWSRDCLPESRFPECAVIKNVRWVHFQGKIRTTLLSRGTSYAAYFVFKINVDSSRFSTRFSSAPVKVLVSAIREDELLRDNHVVQTKSVYLEAPTSNEQRRKLPPGDLPVVRGDGWMEIEMGRYQVGVNGENAELDMSLRVIETHKWKNGLTVCGIEIRPLS